MRRTHLRLCGAMLSILCAAFPVRAGDELQSLRVELKSDIGGVLPPYELQLYDLRNHQRAETAQIQPDGAFTLRHVPYGEYQLVIADPAGDPVHTEFLTVSGITSVVSVSVKGIERLRAPGGPVSVTQLQHPPAKKAFQAMLNAQRYSEAGDYRKAAEELEKAVRISPYYAEAYTNLAAQHIRLGRYQEADQELMRALEIAGPNPLVLTNLATAEYSLQHGEAAANYARAALRMEPNYARAHLVLGLALCVNTRTAQEGLEHLRKAAQTIPTAQQQVRRVEQALR